jgi:hypothetical protein
LDEEREDQRHELDRDGEFQCSAKLVPRRLIVAKPERSRAKTFKR